MASQASRFDLPGFRLPLNFTLRRGYDSPKLFPNALDYNDLDGGAVGRSNTHRDLLMMQAVHSITEKPEWDRKAFDDEITSKWRDELLNCGKDITPKMVDWIVKELQWKAGIFRETGYTVAFDPGVVKADNTIPFEMQKELKNAVRPLEDVAEEEKDYHPGSDQKVVDLVHPSLFPVIYGRTRILPDHVIRLDDCLSAVGQGQLLPVPPKEQARLPSAFYDRSGYHRGHEGYSRKFQWLPCDIELTSDDGCRIASYINNLHPQKHRGLYQVIEKILARTIPLWNATLNCVESDYKRIAYRDVEFEEHPEPEPRPANEEEKNSDVFWDRHWEWEISTPIKKPEPGEFKPPEIRPYSKVNLREQFSKTGLQVIVKLANIELTPEKPEYEGGSWHVEGQLNEHICATALYYYDSENITESTLSFRQRACEEDMNEVMYPQDQHAFLHHIFGFPPDVDSRNGTVITQDLGSVSTHEGRLLTFPNILQHRVSPFSLADKSKPGHRKILAFFLVDPNLRIISSANVLPQREDWWTERRVALEESLTVLPPELRNMVHGEMDVAPITMDEAKQYRLELMEERRAAAVEHNSDFENGNFNLCEH